MWRWMCSSFCRCLQQLQPLVFMFDLPSFPAAMTMCDGSQVTIVQQVQQTYGVTVSIRPHQRGVHTFGAACVVIVRGSVCDSKAVKEATAFLFEHFTGGVGV